METEKSIEDKKPKEEEGEKKKEEQKEHSKEENKEEERNEKEEKEENKEEEKEKDKSPSKSPSKKVHKTTILPVGKSVIFYSPVETREVLVRTGTIEKFSLLHAFLHAYSRDYLYMDNYERKKAVIKLRKDLAKKMNPERWENVSGSLVAKNSFQETVSDVFTDVYAYIQDGKPGTTRTTRKVIRELKGQETTYDIIFDMISLQDIERKLLPSIYDKYSDESIEKCSNEIVKKGKKFYRDIFQNLKGKIKEKKVKFCVEKFGEILEKIVKQAEETAFTYYISNLKSTRLDVDKYLLSDLSTRFNRDLYFIDGKSRLPCFEGNEVENRKSIILVKIQDHYEVLGKLLPDNKIKREFSYDDPLIDCIKTFVYDREKIPSLHPHLISYMKTK